MYLKDTRKLYHNKFEVLNMISEREREMFDPFFTFLLAILVKRYWVSSDTYT